MAPSCCRPSTGNLQLRKPFLSAHRLALLSPGLRASLPAPRAPPPSPDPRLLCGFSLLLRAPTRASHPAQPPMREQTTEQREPLLARSAASAPSETSASEVSSSGMGTLHDAATAGPAGTAATVTTGTTGTTAPALHQQQQAAPPACRICLQDDDPDSLEQPCSCSGSMAWAHHACIQRWINEKHDKQCEVCRQQFQGAFTDPPPRPPPAPLVAQLQVDNAGQSHVLLADPETGAIVARVVVPPGAELPEGAFAWAGHAAPAADESDEEEEEGAVSRRACNPFLLLLLFAAIIGAFAWLATAAEAGPGAEGAQAGTWFVRLMLLSLWVYLRTMRPGVPRRHRPVGLDLERRQQHLTFVDLEAGLHRQRRQTLQQHQQQQAAAQQQGQSGDAQQ